MRGEPNLVSLSFVSGLCSLVLAHILLSNIESANMDLHIGKHEKSPRTTFFWKTTKYYLQLATCRRCHFDCVGVRNYGRSFMRCCGQLDALMLRPSSDSTQKL